MPKTGKVPLRAAPNLLAVLCPRPCPHRPFPNSDSSYGGSPEIGVPDTNAPPAPAELSTPGPNGAAWEQSRVKVYGWLAGSFDLSTLAQFELSGRL